MHLNVVVADCDVDAALVERPGEDESPTLVLRPTLTFSGAVRAIRRTIPGMHPDAVRSLVRKHLPNAADIDSLLEVTPPLPQRVADLSARSRLRMWIAVALALAAVVAGPTIGLAHLVDSARASNPGTPSVQVVEPTIYDRDSRLNDAAGARCTTLSVDHLVCDVPFVGHGEVDAFAAPGLIRYTYNFGNEFAVVHAYATADDAMRFVHDFGRAFTHVERVGPYVVNGTSALIVSQIVHFIRTGASRAHQSLR